ncbi:MAG: hypothetical protein ACRBFS_02585 [Aureispira sp.]
MTSLKDLKKRAGLVAKQVNVNKVIFSAALDLLEKGKIPKPEKVFKDTVPKINRKAKYTFLFLDMGQKKYFLMGDIFPMGNDLSKKIEETEKKLAKAKKPVEKEFLEQMLFFYQELNKLTPKGFATGIIKFSREVQNSETEETEYLMALKTSGLKVGGAVKKGNIVPLVREELGYRLTSKLGEVMFLEADAEEVEQTVTPEQTTATGIESPKTGDPTLVTKQVKQLLGQFKAIEPKQAFKGLGLIHKMSTLVSTLEETPENLQTLVGKLKKQQEKFTPILSKQIDNKLTQSMTQLEEIQVVESSNQLNEVFGTVKKMYAGWKQFLEGKEHPSGEVIEKVGTEIDILKQYEVQLVPLRKQYQEMQNVDQKNELGKQINALIQEARQAIA